MTKYVPISPDHSQFQYLDVGGLLDDGQFLRIGLWDGTKSLVEITFDDSLLVRMGDEGDLMKQVSEIVASGGGSWIYSVHDSELATWFEDQSHGVRDKHIIQHHCVAGANSIVDVLSLSGPKVLLLPTD